MNCTSVVVVKSTLQFFIWVNTRLEPLGPRRKDDEERQTTSYGFRGRFLLF